MQISYSRGLMDCISWFTSSSSERRGKSKLVEIYSRELCDIFKLSKAILEDILSSDIALDENLSKILHELTNRADEARKLEKGWHSMTSKICFALEIEPLIKKIKSLLQETFSIFHVASHSVEQCSCTNYVEKLQDIPCQRVSDIIREAVQEQLENLVPRPEYIIKIEDTLSLSRNEELLIEILALDKHKEKLGFGDNLEEVEYIDHIIELVNYMHDCYVEKYQVQNINNVPVPADFCCPLSLELMSDPVIVASGQTYERVFIKKWLEQGFTLCPKTRQMLSHTNLIPNYTVKALIGNWCDTNNIKLPNPVKVAILNSIDAGIPNTGDPTKHSDSVTSEPFITLNYTNRDPLPSNGHICEAHLDDMMVSSHLQKAMTGQPMQVTDVSGDDIGKLSLTSTDDNASTSEKLHGDYGINELNRSNYPSHFSDNESEGHIGSISASPYVGNTNDRPLVGNVDVISRVQSDLTHYSSDGSGELTQEASSSTLHREPELPPNMGESSSHINNFRRRPSDRFGLRDLSGIEAQVRKLVGELRSDSIDEQRTAATELRQLARHSTENRIVIANCGVIPLLVSLLRSSDPKTQENAVTALLNLSINDNNKVAIGNAEAIDPLIHVLETGTAEAKENAAATLFSLSVIEENKAKIGRSGAIVPLVDLLSTGTPGGKKDAATALFNLSIFHDNKLRIVQAGAVKHLVELMDPAAGMVDKAVAVLSNLATIPEGKSSIVREGAIPYLVEVVELGSARGKENAAAALLQLCTASSKFSSMVLQEGAIPPLVALSQSGTPRAKEKAQSLLAHFRNQRRVNSVRP